MDGSWIDTTARRLVTRRALTGLGAGLAGSALGVGAAEGKMAACATAIKRAPDQYPPGVRPNIILIVADDLHWSVLEQMPNIGVLLRDQGTSFSECFVTQPSCGPSRASILRGQYVHNHGMLGNKGSPGGFRRFHQLEREASTIATWLQDTGYRTGLVGKYLNGYPDGAEPGYVPPGWNEWFGLISHQYHEFKYNDNGHVGRTQQEPEQYQTDVLSQRARAFIEEAVVEADPFFLYLATKAPHRPATPAARHRDAFPDAVAPRSPQFNEADVSDKPAHLRARAELDGDQIDAIDDAYRNQLRAMLAVDEMVADLVETLSSTGVLGDTYIFFTADNGVLLGEHRYADGKGLPYNPSLQVPLLVRGPGIPEGRTENRLVVNSDLAPTIAQLAGAPVPEYVDGRSLLPLLRGEQSVPWRQVVLAEDIAKLSAGAPELSAIPDSGADAEDGDDDDDGGESARGGPYRALRSVDLFFVDWATGEREVYDLRLDPFQLRNLASTADPVLLVTLGERLEELAECTGMTCRAAEDLGLPPLS